MKPVSIRWVWHVASMEEKCIQGFGNMRNRDHFEYMGVDRKILNRTFKKQCPLD
jgi:hypothetical protein